MTLTRNPIGLDLPLSLSDARRHARIDASDEDILVHDLIRAAAADIEDAAAIALLPQTVTFETLPRPGRVIPLPIGPAVTDAANAVVALAEDGTATVLAAWQLIAGPRPRVELAEEPAHRVRVTYRAQIAATGAALPADLRHAIADQVARAFDHRGGMHDRGPALSAASARVIARYRGVRA